MEEAHLVGLNVDVVALKDLTPQIQQGLVVLTLYECKANNQSLQ